MGVNWNLYERLLDGDIGVRQISSNDAVDSFFSGVVDDPAYQENSKVNGTITPLVISRKSAIECAMKAAPSTNIHIGDMVECFDEHWIVMELYIDKVGILAGTLWLCNENIKFQNHSAEIHTRHCVVDDGTYSKKSSDPDAFVMANTYKIYLTIDDATKRIFIDKRLAFGVIYSSDGKEILEVYKVIGMDVKTRNFGAGSHLMVLTVQRDVYNAQTDSLTDNICDIYNEEKTTSTPSVAGNCVISGRDSIRIGTSRKYSASFVDGNNSDISGIAPVWNLVVPEGVSYTIEDDVCTLTVPLEERLLGEEIIITLQDTDGKFGYCEMKVQVVTIG